MTQRNAIPATEPGAAQLEARPLVGRPVSNRGPWLFAGGLAVAAVLLFSALEGRRAASTARLTAPVDGTGEAGFIAAPPALAIPSDPGMAAPPAALPAAPLTPALALPIYPPRPTVRVGSARPMPSASVVRTPAYYDPNSPDPMYVPPTAPPPAEPPVPRLTEQGATSGDRLAGGRVGAVRLINPATTVPQGAVIQAVLETAIDSNRPGFARAVVSRDVRSFDGSAVLIPRGSRLFGEYKSDLAVGQNRAFVNWQRLTRPDGVQIAIESPAADSLGGAGIKGKVDTHFFQRFGGAVLQSALDIGVGLATRRASGNTVVIGLPDSTQRAIQPNPQAIRPTLKVRQGSRVSVFVARDLDFAPVQ